MHLSGILVLTDPERLQVCRRQLESLPGVEVHHTDRPSGRMIAVLESATLDGQAEGLRAIQELDAVHLAALVEHRIDRPPLDEDDRRGQAAGPGREVG